MLARHPRTGNPIRVIKSEGSVWRDSKTLVWLDGSESEENWSRYDIAVSSVEAWVKVQSKMPITALILLGDLDMAEAWIRSGKSSSVKVLVVPKSLLLKIGYADLIKLRISNMLCIDEAFDMYPFLEKPWDGTEHDARLMTALVLRYGRTAPINSACSERTKIAGALGLSVLDTLVVPPKLVLITQYYVPDKKRRANEIDLSLKRNVECPCIDKIVLLNESMLELPVKSEKIHQENVGTRLRFDIVFKWIYEKGSANTVYVIANSDIYMDTSLDVVWSIDMKDRFLSLLRWDDSDRPDEKPTLFGPRADSQDTWIVSSDSLKSRTWDWDSLNIPFGKGGCDNAINVEMLRQKFLVVNPCLTIITHHVHTSEYRTYDPKDIVDKPVYMHVNPTGIHDLKPEMNLPGTPFKTLEVNASVPILKGPSATQKETFYTMLERSKVIKKSDGIIVGDRKIPLYKFSNIIESCDGLVSTYNSIYIGNSKTVSDAWSVKQMNVVSPCVDVDIALVAYLSDEIATNPYRYMLEYLGKILVLQDVSKGGEFLAINNDVTKDVLNLFNWKAPTIPVLARDLGFQAWCKTAYVWYRSDAPECMPTPQEITALRNAFQFKWDNSPSDDGRILCLIDGIWITEKLIIDLEEKIGGDGMKFVAVREADTLLELVEKFNGATGLLTFANNPMNALSWLLPNKAKVWEVQSEIKPSVDLLHLSHVAGLNHTLHIVARQNPQNDIERQMLLSAMCKAIDGLVLTPPPKSVAVAPQLPEIRMPAFNLEGFFAHTGDSFREIVKMWGERKYVKIKECEVNNIWLGETLLYDRPTLKWLEASPSVEQKWKHALFGNPAPPEGGRAWSFWPRRPRIVEELVGRGTATKDFNSRTLGTVFYGRSENAVQKANRTMHDWAPACDDYVHLEGSSTPYPYSHREYLERLSMARWGLCLAGFGKKCHREIECMAMGCVPVVAPEVDMVSYADPPVEGLHYIRVQGPADMARLKDISPEEWEKMSSACKAWWSKNSSVKGLWELTQKLAPV
jgi:hypothetical protein